MDVTKLAEQVLGSLTKDKSLLSAFTGDPTKIVKQIIGVDIPDDIVSKVIEAVKAQLGSGALDAAKEVAEKAVADKGGILGGLKNLLGK